jgi:SAM-dependent methyltransferase
MRELDLSLHEFKKPSLRVLDLANGRLRPQYYILQTHGYRVCGIDVLNQAKHGWRDYAYHVARWLYRQKICTGVSISDANLVCGDVSSLPFRDQSIDIVTSVAAFEHFLEVPVVVKEIYRVIKPGGLVWLLIHLFSSPSGGHNVSLVQVPLRKLPQGIEPWDHLRKRRLSFHVPLNEWRREQYLAEFQKQFEIVKHYCAMLEGEHLLTPEIETELSSYSRDELTCGAYVIVVRRPL